MIGLLFSRALNGQRWPGMAEGDEHIAAGRRAGPAIFLMPDELMR